MKKLLLLFITILSVWNVAICQNYREPLNKVNRFLESFDNGYYGPLSVENGSIYCQIKDGRKSRIPIDEIGEVRIIDENRKVGMFCKSGNCVTGVNGSMYPKMSFSTNVDFNAAGLKRDLEALIRALKGKSSPLADLNNYLETFDNGYYGPLIVENGKLYCTIKDGRKSHIALSDIGEVSIVTPNREVAILCKFDGCITGVDGSNFNTMPFSTNQDFDTDELAEMLNRLVNDLRQQKQVVEPENEGPQILITQPSNRGFTVVPTKMVTVAGRAIDPDGIYEVMVNGREADLQTGGYFSVDVPLAMGENDIKVTAKDIKMATSVSTFQVSREANDVVKKESIDQNTNDEKRVALIFGNAYYEGVGSLGENPINDAKEIAATLRSLGFEVTLKTNATLSTMNTAIREFGRANKDADVALFYFAGHGMQVAHKNYLLPIGVNISDPNDLDFECVKVGTVQKIMETSNPNRLNLIILDACRNNPYRSWERGGETGLADMTPPSGTLIAFATSPGSVASNGSGTNGLYTGELIKQLKKAQRIEDVFINTRIEVERKSGGRQSPWELARLRGKYFLVK